MKLGNFEIYSVLDGFFKLDGGAMFGRVPKEVWKKTNPPDRKNRILLALRCLLIKTGKHNILIDTGIGGGYDRKFMQRFAINRKVGLEGELKQLDLSLEDIDIVINTHLHFDHCGGNNSLPRAKFFIQKEEWVRAFSDNPLTGSSYIPGRFLGFRNEPHRLKLIEEETAQVEPGITLIKAGGHTKGHQIVKIESDGKTALYLGDLVPTITHLNYPFVMAYDIEPLETVRKKMEILPKAAADYTLLVFEHEPKYGAALIKIKDQKILVSAEVRL